MSSYAVVRTDQMFATDDRNGMRSLKYMGTGSTATAIENGNVVKLDGLAAIDTSSDYRQVFKGVTPSASDSIDDIVLVATPEVLYDDQYKDLADFRNEAGDIARGYRLHSGDIFSVTAEALNGTASVGSIIELQADTKLNVVSTLTSGSTQVGTCIAVETAGTYTFYVIHVA